MGSNQFGPLHLSLIAFSFPLLRLLLLGK